MSEINRIETLIHPDFLLMQELRNGEPFIHHQNELELRRRWDDIAVSVAQDPNSRFVYFTWLTQREMVRAAESAPENPWRNLDFERIEEYRLMIGRRMTVAPLFPRYTSLIVNEILAGGTLTNRTELYMQGEWTNACVRREGNDLADVLGIEKDRRIIVPDKSRFSWEGKHLLDWHRSFHRGV